MKYMPWSSTISVRKILHNYNLQFLLLYIQFIGYSHKGTLGTLLYNNMNLGSFVCFIRSSHRRCSIKKGVPRDIAKFTGKHLCQSLFLNKVAVLRPATLLKKRHLHRCFPVNFAKFLRTTFCRNTSE